MAMTEAERAAYLRWRAPKSGVALGFSLLNYFKWWFIGLTALLIIVVSIVGQFVAIETTMWGHLAAAGKYFLAILAGMVLYEIIPGLISAGVTRREISIMTVIAGMVVSLSLAIIVTIGMFAEHFIYRLVGWTQASPTFERSDAMTSMSDVLIVSSAYFIVFPMLTCVGHLIGAAFFRSSWLGGVVTIPAAISAFTIDGAIFGGEGFRMFGFLSFIDTSVVWAIIAAFVVAIISVWVAHRCLINSDVNSVSA
ncbi:hypothetical protein [Natronoglycomyces albus]|uniref:Uncharacterized protein n=1 Tax=Natronoglycomyces albus TaxID=2811108 RepID=A0A895XTJ2_9ACTN|nr:hypothetical protein [Natronoglycomyces albus]QSB06625.1 hypothetical protein JQS30_06945 [Natronoglycomyces albus]